MSGKSSTFAVIDLNRSMRWPVEVNRKNDALTLALDQLIRKQCQLVSMTAQRDRFQATIQFESVRACLEAVGEFARASFAASRLALPARIGIATGEAPELTRPEEHPAHRRARWLAGLSPDPAILLSDVTAFLARDIEMHPYGIDELGDVFNMELGSSATVFCLLHPQLSPPRKIDDDAPRHNLPDLNEFFIGREEEVENVTAYLERNRVVSLFGPSGVGKSTLAIRIGWGLIDQFRDGIKYVDLSRAKDRSDVLLEIFKSINLPIDHLPRLGLDLLRRHFGDKRHLIILDGCDGVARLLTPVIKALVETRHVKILATSMLPLETAEQSVVIEDFPLPESNGVVTIEELQKIDSCALLIDGIHRFRQGRPPVDADVPDIIDLVRKVNGNPFAIFLASRRLRTESLREILDSFKNVKWISTERNPAIEVTLRSFDKTTGEVLRSSAMFVDPWTRHDLADMMEVPHSELTEPLETLCLSGLVTESMDEEGRGLFILNPHFRHEIWLLLAGEESLFEYRQRHFFAINNRLEKSIAELRGPNQRKHLDMMDRIRGDIEAILRFVIDTSDEPSDFISIMGSLWPFWYKRNRLLTVVALADAALAKYADKDIAAQVRFIMLQAVFITKVGNSEEAIPLLEHAYSLVRRKDLPFLKCQLLINLGIALWASGRPEEAIEVYDRAHNLADKIDDPDLMSSISCGMFSPLIDIKDINRAAIALEELRKSLEDSEDRFDLWNLAMGNAEYWCESGDVGRARHFIEKALKEADYIHDPSLVGRVYLWKSRIEVEAANLEQAAMDLGICLHYMNSGEHGPYQVNLRRIRDLNTYLESKLGTHATNELKMRGVIEL